MTADHSADPLSPRRINVSIKTPESARYKGDNPWFTFEGSSAATVKAMIVDAFDLKDTGELSLSDVVMEAQTIASGLSAAKSGLGGRVIGEGKSSGSAFEQARQGAGSAPANDGPSEEEVELARLTAAVEAATTVAELQDLWARNQAAFKNDDLMTAYKAKGKLLSAA